jgi:hypothetical protein
VNSNSSLLHLEVMTGLVVLLVVALAHSSTAYTSGHPDSPLYCNQKTPLHGSSASVLGGGSAYQVTAERNTASTIQVCIKTIPNGNQPYFEGFFLKALRCDSKGLDFKDHVGSFSIQPGAQESKLICPRNSAVTHTSHIHLTQTCMTWEPPTQGVSLNCVNFCATVVRNYELYHYDVCSMINVCI